MKSRTKLLIAIICIFSVSVYAGPTTTSEFIKIDQFGYLPNSEKVAVISDPQTGYNSALSFTPGTTYQVRDWTTDAVVFSAAITSWNAGAVHAQSGDIVYWFDFSAVTTAGSYYIFDPTNNVGSYRFEINSCVYNEVMKHAMRMFYYQRCGVAKQSPYVDAGYVDAACHIGTQQDTDCRLYNNTNASTAKDLSGGWHDAGDYNKYVNFAWSAVIDMLLAYEQNPSVWLDNYNIPESGNGVPDLLDEVKVEMDWLLKMQNSDGSVLSIVGIQGYSTAYSPPSVDNKYRVYGPATTAASISGAAMYALAAIQFKSAGQIVYASVLETAAINAWTWANANPNVQFFNAGVIQAGEQQISAQELSDRKIGAAVYLYALTGTAAYKTYVENNYQAVHLIAWGKAYIYETYPQDALLYYAALPGATPSVASMITSTYAASLGTSGHPENLRSYLDKTDAYRAFLNDMEYHWGSNVNKDVMASMLLVMNYYNLDPGNATNYTNDAAGYLHYLHGVNPNSKTYLTNMGNYGAENSTTSIYHLWFIDGSPLWDEVGVSTYGPAPGYLPGGPNKDYNIDGCCPAGCGSYSSLCNTNVNPPMGQPAQKSWKDFNPDWPLNSFSVTEPQMFYQATYIRMLSMFLNPVCNQTTGINKLDSKHLVAIYPSPISTNFTLQIKTPVILKNAVLKIYDVCGKEVRSVSVKNSETILSRDELRGGIYFYKVINDHESIGNGKLIFE